MDLIEALKRIFFSGGKLGIQVNLAETKDADNQSIATVLRIENLSKFVLWNYDDYDDVWRPLSFDLNEAVISVDRLLSYDYIVVDFEETVPKDKQMFEIGLVDDCDKYYWDD